MSVFVVFNNFRHETIHCWSVSLLHSVIVGKVIGRENFIKQKLVHILLVSSFQDVLASFQMVFASESFSFSN